MGITRENVEYVAMLSRIRLAPGETERFTEQLARILDYVNQLEELDTTDVEPMSHPLAVANVFRHDEARPGLPPDEAVGNAPESKAHFFKVPRVIDEA